jgi:UDP-N-acetylmuramoyl-L-alanyl-D-glutamate--2,6-diaminopimelate ligase
MPTMTSPRAGAAVDWLSLLPQARIVAGEPGNVTAVCFDSRRVVPGALFVAVVGLEADGHRFLRDALDRGATALLLQEDRRELWESFVGKDAAIVAVPDTRAALACAAAGFYGRPATKLGVVGVTGTDGKTTTVHLIAHLLESAGRPAGYLSSAAFSAQGRSEPVRNASHLTTLEAPFVQERLAAMVEAGMRYAVIEASSHGLALHRVDECAFDVAVFTTLSRDHLDFHDTMDEYRDAKGRLFRMLDGSPAKDGIAKAAVVNVDDPASEYFRSQTNAPVITCGIDSPASVRAEAIELRGLTSRFRLRTPSSSAEVSVQVAGRYNVSNCIAAAAVALSQGASIDEIARGLASFPGVPAHLELIECGQAFRVVVDIASTPAAMRRVLEVLRTVTQGRLCVVFGAAGERDPARRDGIGRVVGELADFSVLTNEDPRREDPQAIIEKIASGLRGVGRKERRDFARVPDRREAIRYAFERARPGDTVLLAGKGTEPSIEMAAESIAWDEAQVARELLVEWAKGG